MEESEFKTLEEYLLRIPGINGSIGKGVDEEGLWWIKFQIDIRHVLAWNVVQEIGHIVNYLSIDERLPTIFYSVSPPPYMNGGPDDFLSWVIETSDKDFRPEKLKEWLEGRLPRPVEDEDKWKVD